MARYASRFDDFVLLLLEHPRGLTCQDAAQHLGVSRQTAYKYIDLARSRLGYNLVRETDGRYRLPAKYLDDARHTFTLTTAEIHDLMAAMRSLGHVSGHLKSAVEKFRLGLGGIAAQEFEDEPVVHFADADPTVAGVYERAVRAAREHRVLDLSYLAASGKELRLWLRPYGLIVQNGHIYLVGHATVARLGRGQMIGGTTDGRPSLLRLRLDQVQRASVTPFRFRPEPFSLAEFVSGAFGPFAPKSPPERVRIWISAKKAGFVKRTRRHPSQACAHQPDGSCVLSLHLPITDDLVWWVAGYGRHARVLEPLTLRARVIEHARGILEANAGDPEGVPGSSVGEEL